MFYEDKKRRRRWNCFSFCISLHRSTFDQQLKKIHWEKKAIFDVFFMNIIELSFLQIQSLKIYIRPTKIYIRPYKPKKPKLNCIDLYNGIPFVSFLHVCNYKLVNIHQFVWEIHIWLPWKQVSNWRGVENVKNITTHVENPCYMLRTSPW